MTLSEKIKPLSRNPRTFLLWRIAGLDVKFARELAGVAQGTYNVWTQNEEFSALYRQLPDLTYQYKQEATKLLRRENQLDAVLIEGKILRTMKEELDTKEYNLIKTASS